AKGTRRQIAGALADRALADGALVALLAEEADEAVFGPADPTDEQIHRYWAHLDRYVAQVAASRPRIRRLIAPINPVSLRRQGAGR
ncbi:MAG: transglutaminase domain-containing protein, partial [Dactylosporangium sp.]|nr:hypothetical protein [Dactylosporangium sp.]NNJ61420.1 transglutaminase domain-containing protein [Dactylosporangium sp.]